MDMKPEKSLKADESTELLQCKTWDAEAALRMLLNNLNPKVARNWEELIVYGGSGRAARNWKEFHKIIRALKDLEPDETLCIQSGKPVYIAPTHIEAPRVILANSNLVGNWATQDYFDDLDRLGLMMYGQMTAGSWIYIGTQGILQGTYESFAAASKMDFKTDSLVGKLILTGGMGAMSGAQPMAGTLNDAVILDVEVKESEIARKVEENYCDRLTHNIDEAIEWALEAKKKEEPLSIGLVGNAAQTHPELVKRGIIPDIVTDQTCAHEVKKYVPIGYNKNYVELLEDGVKIREGEYVRESFKAMASHVKAMIDMQTKGAIVFDYGNAIRNQVELALDIVNGKAPAANNMTKDDVENLRQHLKNIGISSVRNDEGGYAFPGFVLKYVRPLFCEGKGPFRWACLSGNPKDLAAIDDALISTFPDDKPLIRWIDRVREKVPILGLPTRICWLGYGERAKFGLIINNLIKEGTVTAPVVIGRDHLDCGSVASPSRETEGMKDGSDAIADWPLLNFALNAVNGASWVSFHHGGGVGIGNSLHAGMVIVADGTSEKAKRLQRVLTVDPGTGIARHVDAGYEIASNVAKERKVKIPK
ncbi:MAG: urocanate hydratase [Candidatus Heimdallarchaeota archaeon]|nr:urocanate hydratase [Candidatus Heimdallarchaeota archaeon]